MDKLVIKAHGDKKSKNRETSKKGGGRSTVSMSSQVVDGARALLRPEALTWGPGKTLKENSWQQRGGEEGALPGTKERVGDFLFP